MSILLPFVFIRYILMLICYLRKSFTMHLCILVECLVSWQCEWGKLPWDASSCDPPKQNFLCCHLYIFAISSVPNRMPFCTVIHNVHVRSSRELCLLTVLEGKIIMSRRHVFMSALFSLVIVFISDIQWPCPIVSRHLQCTCTPE
jgi:hypothetical protein